MIEKQFTLMRFSKLVFAIVVVAIASVDGAKTTTRYRGDAYDLKTGEFLYSENHSEFYEAGKHLYSTVSYRDAAGREFASKKIFFAPNPMQPTYELKDGRDGYLEGIRREGGATVYYARRKADQELRAKQVRAPEPAVFDGGFDYFVRKNFDLICSGANQAFNFAVPIELDYFRFRVARQSAGDTCRMQLELDNALLRAFVKPIKLWYDARDKRLLRYEGISNINGPDGKSLKVRIVFTYPGR